MVSSDEHLASAAGADVLARGGSAVDAALAANAVLAVTSPQSCGMGGDLWAVVHGPGLGAPVVLNASGRAGSGADAERLRASGATQMPLTHDIRAVTVPGCVDGWMALHERFGRLALDEVFARAIDYADHGFPASIELVRSLAAQIAPRPTPGSEELLAQVHAPGDLVRRAGVARTLRAIAAGGRDALYGGEFGRGLLALGAGEFTGDDLATGQADWVAPLHVDVWGHTVWTAPPNSQAYLALAGAWIAAGLELPDNADDVAFAHLLAEAAAAAGHDRPSVLHEAADGGALLSPDRLAPRRAAIDATRAGRWGPTTMPGDTTYLCAVDADRMGVSLIQSNAAGFGSGLFEPTTGINLHDRGLGFNLVAGHSAEYGPGRRPPHTLSPLLVTGPDGSPRFVLGTMGGDAQPQILLQLLARLLHYGQSPGRAVGSGRWVLAGPATGFDTWTAPSGRRLEVEAHAAESWVPALRALGHDAREILALSSAVGHAHVIAIDPRGVLLGAADPRVSSGAVSAY